MRTPTTCPKCGAELEEGWENVYECGSSFYTEGPQVGLVDRSSCWKRQRDQLLQKLQQLLEAGNQMAFEVPYADRFNGWKAWRKLTKDMK